MTSPKTVNFMRTWFPNSKSIVFQSGAGSAEDCPFGKTCLEGACRNDSSDYIIYCDCPPDTNTYEVGAPDISYCRGMYLQEYLLVSEGNYL